MILGRPDRLNWKFQPQLKKVKQLVGGGQILDKNCSTVENDQPIEPSWAVGNVLSILPTNEIEEVVDYQVGETGPKFLIKWKGLSQKYNTWEPLSNMEKCKSLSDKLLKEQSLSAKRCSLTQVDIADKTTKLVGTGRDSDPPTFKQEVDKTKKLICAKPVPNPPTQRQEVDKTNKLICAKPGPDPPTQSQEVKKTHKSMCAKPDPLWKSEPQIPPPVADTPRLKSRTARISSKVKVNKFTCTVCTKTFAWSHSVTRHMKIHSEGDNRPYKCSICPAAFTRNQHLKTHIRRHSGEKPFKCQDCSKTFVKKSQLTRHRMNHTGQKPFQCTACGKRFADKWTWNNHKRRHTGEKPFSCHLCDKTYMINQSLRRHMRSHKGQSEKSEIKQYRCVFCSQSFKNKRCLYKHHRSSKCLNQSAASLESLVKISQ